MKCTLRKVDGSIVATIDERPKVSDYAYDVIEKNWRYVDDEWIEDTDHKIIASTIPNVGKELKVNYKGQIMAYLVRKKKELEFNKQYDYTETDNQVIIQL